MRKPFGFALATTAASGAAALAHELLWTRRLVDLLGESSHSTARVLGCFFLGLALGSLLAAKIAKRITRPWRAVACAELGVAILVLPALLLPEWTADLWPALGPDLLVSAWGGWIKGLIAVLVVVPPAVLMGMVLPLLAQAVLTGRESLDRQGLWLYAMNTAGGVLGLAGTLILLLPMLGVLGAMLAATGANLLLAVACFFADRLWPAAEVETNSAQSSSRSEPEIPRAKNDFGIIMLCSFASGAGVLGAEVAVLGEMAFVAPGAMQANAAVLAAVIVALALAAAIAPWLLRTGARWTPSFSVSKGIVFASALAALVCGIAPFVLSQATGGMQVVTGENMFYYLLKICGLLALVFGPVFLLIGLVFPLTSAWLAETDPRGKRWGWLLAANGLGGLAGVEGTRHLLLPWLTPSGCLGGIGCGYALLALLLAIRCGWAGWKAAIFPALAFCLTAWFTISAQTISPLSKSIREYGYVLIDRYHASEGMVMVARHPVLGKAIVLPGDYVLGSSSAKTMESRQAYLPLLLHPAPRRIAFIAVATGIPAGTALSYPAVEEVVGIEISPLVVRAAGEYFAEENNGLISSPRASIIKEDARTYLAACENEFDLVVGDYFLPWRSGAGRLHSLEHYLAVRRSLRPGGLFCQWLPLYDMGREQADLAIATFTRAFGETHLVRGSYGSRWPVVMMVGSAQGEIDWQGVSARCRDLRQAGITTDSFVHSADSISAAYLGKVTRKATHDLPINSLGDPKMEFSAGRMRLSGNWREKTVAAENWLAFEKSYVSLAPAELFGQDLSQVGLLISRWRLAKERGDKEQAAQLRFEITRSLPLSLRQGFLLPEWLDDLLR